MVAVVSSAALFGACRVDRATIFEPIGRPSFDFSFSPPATAAERALPGGTITVSRPGPAGSTAAGTVRIRLTNLQPLTSGVYQVFIGTQAGDTLRDVIPARGTLRVIRPVATVVDTTKTLDTTVTANVSSTNAGGANVVLEFTLNEASLGSNPTLPGRNVVLVSMQASETTTPPAIVSPLFGFFTTPAAGATAVTTNLLFGNYEPVTSRRYVFQAVGRGRGGVRGNVLAIDDTLLARPPIGFFYAAFALRTDSAGNALAPEYLGELTAPFPNRDRSLRNADTDTIAGVVFDRPAAISAASLRFVTTSDTAFVLRMGNIDIVIVLISKFAAEGSLPPNRILKGTLPGIVTSPPVAARDSTRP